MTSKKFTCFTLCYVGSQEIIVRWFPSSWLCVLLLLWCKVTWRRQRCANVSKFDINMQHRYIPRNVSFCFSRHLPIFIIEKLQRERHIATILLLINKDKSILNIKYHSWHYENLIPNTLLYTMTIEDKRTNPMVFLDLQSYLMLNAIHS